MELLYYLRDIRNPFLDSLFLFITQIGEEMFFLGIAILFFWCINKREGYFLLMTGLMGIIINQALKLALRIPRPAVIDLDFEPVEGASKEAKGYSFPSGHTQNAAGTLGVIGVSSKRRALKLVSLVLVLLVAFSRMYLGVHTIFDVAASLFIAALIVIILEPVFKDDESFHKYMPILAIVSTVMSAGLMIYAFALNEQYVDISNLVSTKENASTILGCIIGLLIVYPIDRCCVNFKTGGKWYSQFIKLALGLAAVLILLRGLESPLEFIMPDVYSARVLRYLTVVLFVGIIYPLSFSFYSKLRIKCLDRLTDKIKGLVRKNNTDMG